MTPQKNNRKKKRSDSKLYTQFLLDVAPDNYFKSQDKKIFRNLEELRDGLKEMRMGIFLYHVHPGVNDFSQWIYDCIGDVSLVNELIDCSDKKKYIQIITKRITQLKKYSKK